MAKLTGKILYIYPTQQLTSKSGNAFQKRDFVVAMQTFDRDTGEATIDNDNTPVLTLTGDRCSQLDSIKQGDIVTVDFYLRGRRYRDDAGKEKIITDINVSSVKQNAMLILPVTNPPRVVPIETPATPAAPAQAPAPQPKDPNDDLPF